MRVSRSGVIRLWSNRSRYFTQTPWFFRAFRYHILPWIGLGVIFWRGLAWRRGWGLGGWFHAKRKRSAVLLRPPGAGGEDEFLAACIRCQQCVEACPWDSLRMAGVEAGAGMGTPYVVSRAVPCYLCEGYDELKCIVVCPTDALRPVADRREIRMGTAVIDEGICVAFGGAFCRACVEACPISGAIIMDDLGRPVVREAVCVGCGLCDKACPTEPSSIPIRPAGAGDDSGWRSKGSGGARGDGGAGGEP